MQIFLHSLLFIFSITFARGVWKFSFLLQNSRNIVSTLDESLPNMSQTETYVGGTFWIKIRSEADRKNQEKQASLRCEVTTQEYS